LADDNYAAPGEDTGNGASTLTAADDAATNGAPAANGNGATSSPAGDEGVEAVASSTAQAELNEQLAPAALPAVEEAAPYRDVPNGRAYELIYIVRAGDAEAIEKTAARVRSLIEDSGGAVDNVRTSETRRLAYAIEKQTEGLYVVVNARMTKETTTELERLLKLEESVLRHMMLREEI